MAIATLDRPEARNAVDLELARALGEAAAAWPGEGVRAAIVTGAGRAFSAGGDISRFEREGDEAAALFAAERRALVAAIEGVAALPFPTVAAINGPATGAGLQLALACDLRLASEEARVGMREHSLGLIPSFGGTARLTRLLGVARAKEVYFAPGLLSAEEALRVGLVSRVVPAGDLLPMAFETAAGLAARAPVATRLAKGLIDSAPDRSLAETLAAEHAAQDEALSTADHKEGVRAFRERRPPSFEGR